MFEIECGNIPKASNETIDLPWNVYIQISHNKVPHKTCPGTIVASDLIVTSHKCLVLQNRRMRLYDILNFKDVESEPLRNIPKIEDMAVTTTKKLQGTTTQSFQVVDILYNPQYTLSSELEEFPENDLALIKIKDSLLSSNRVPVCIPSYDGAAHVHNVAGTFYAYSAYVKTSAPEIFDVAVLEKQACYKQLQITDSPEKAHSSWTKTLCFQFGPGLWYEEGSPLVHFSDISNHKAFLMGVSTVHFYSPNISTDVQDTENPDTFYTSSIFPLVSFIEHFGRVGGAGESVWCETPELKLKHIHGQIPPPFNIEVPWNIITEPLERNESLNCGN